MIEFENEILGYLNLPSLPKKEWNGKSSFARGVAIVNQKSGRQAFAVASFDAENDKEVRIRKAFGYEPFTSIDKVFVVPDYMENDNIADADLDEQSKQKAMELAAEAQEIENEGVDDNTMHVTSEWVFPEIENKEQAIAWLQAYNAKNKIKGRVPQKEDVLKMRLYSIYTEQQKKK